MHDNGASGVRPSSRRRPFRGGPLRFIQSSVSASSTSLEPARPEPRWAAPFLVRRIDQRTAARSITQQPMFAGSRHTQLGIAQSNEQAQRNYFFFSGSFLAGAALPWVQPLRPWRHPPYRLPRQPRLQPQLFPLAATSGSFAPSAPAAPLASKDSNLASVIGAATLTTMWSGSSRKRKPSVFRNILQVDTFIDLQLRSIDRDEIRQHRRKTFNMQFAQGLMQHAAFFQADRLTAGQMDGDLDARIGLSIATSKKSACNTLPAIGSTWKSRSNAVRFALFFAPLIVEK